MRANSLHALDLDQPAEELAYVSIGEVARLARPADVHAEQAQAAPILRDRRGAGDRRPLGQIAVAEDLLQRSLDVGVDKLDRRSSAPLALSGKRLGVVVTHDRLDGPRSVAAG